MIFNSFWPYISMKWCKGNKLKQINQLILKKFSVMHTINAYLAALMKDLRSTAPVFYKQYFTNSGYTITWKSLHFITSKMLQLHDWGQYCVISCYYNYKVSNMIVLAIHKQLLLHYALPRQFVTNKYVPSNQWHT